LNLTTKMLLVSVAFMTLWGRVLKVPAPAPTSSPAASPIPDSNDAPNSSPPVKKTSRRISKTKVVEDDDVALPAEDEEAVTSADEQAEDEGEDEIDLDNVEAKAATKKYVLLLSLFHMMLIINSVHTKRCRELTRLIFPMVGKIVSRGYDHIFQFLMVLIAT
jgi:hypothetical protein